MDARAAHSLEWKLKHTTLDLPSLSRTPNVQYRATKIRELCHYLIILMISLEEDVRGGDVADVAVVNGIPVFEHLFVVLGFRSPMQIHQCVHQADELFPNFPLMYSIMLIRGLYYRFQISSVAILQIHTRLPLRFIDKMVCHLHNA
jgi:hypothetical protein